MVTIKRVLTSNKTIPICSNEINSLPFPNTWAYQLLQTIHLYRSSGSIKVNISLHLFTPSGIYSYIIDLFANQMHYLWSPQSTYGSLKTHTESFGLGGKMATWYFDDSHLVGTQWITLCCKSVPLVPREACFKWKQRLLTGKSKELLIYEWLINQTPSMTLKSTCFDTQQSPLTVKS